MCLTLKLVKMFTEASAVNTSTDKYSVFRTNQEAG